VIADKHTKSTAQHAEEPYITVGAIATLAYFLWFVLLVPVIGMMENSSFDGTNTPSPVRPV
jgi:hypothetical protein